MSDTAISVEPVAGKNCYDLVLTGLNPWDIVDVLAPKKAELGLEVIKVPDRDTVHLDAGPTDNREARTLTLVKGLAELFPDATVAAAPQ